MRAMRGRHVGHGQLHDRRPELLLQLAGGPLGDHAAVVDDGDAVREAVCLLQVGVVSSTVVPSSTSSSTVDHRSLRLAGSRAAVGSSRNRTGGL
jgi:hypothetical protein